MEKCFIYARYSSSNQNETSIEAQMLANRVYAEKKGYEVKDVFIDRALSGKNMDKRKSFLEMIERAKNGEANIIVFHKLDRLSRSVVDTFSVINELRDYNVRVESVIEAFEQNAEGELLQVVMAGLNSYYSKNLSRECRKGMSLLAKSGLHVSGIPPLGFNVLEDRTYEINEIEAEAVKKIFELFVAGHTHPEIIKELNRLGYVNKRGEAFSKNSLLSILRQEKYRACYIWDKAAPRDSKGKRNGNKHKPIDQIVRIEGGMPRIISDELYFKAQEIIKSRSSGVSTSNTSAKYLLSSLIKCGCCNSSFHGNIRRSNRKKGVYVYTSYRCGGKKQKSNLICEVPELRDVYLEELVIDIVKSNIFNEDNISYLVRTLNRKINNENKQAQSRIDLLKSRILKIEKEIKNYTKAIGKGSGIEELIIALETKQVEKDKLSLELEELEKGEEVKEVGEEDIKELFEEINRAAILEDIFYFKRVILKVINELRVGQDEVGLVLKEVEYNEDIESA